MKNPMGFTPPDAVVTHIPAPDTDKMKENAERFARVAIGGDERAAVRRIVLWAVAFGLLISPWPLVAAVPMVLLLASDDLV